MHLCPHQEAEELYKLGIVEPLGQTVGHLAAEVVLEGIGAVEGPQEMALEEHGAVGVGQKPTAVAHQEQEEVDKDGSKMALFHEPA